MGKAKIEVLIKSRENQSVIRYLQARGLPGRLNFQTLPNILEGIWFVVFRIQIVSLLLNTKYKTPYTANI